MSELDSEIMKNIDEELIVLGDLNIDQLVPNNDLYNTIKTNNMKQLISEPTRITETSKCLIDIILVNTQKNYKVE